MLDLVSLRILKPNRAALDSRCRNMCVFVHTFVCTNHLMFIGCYLSVNVFLGECVCSSVYSFCHSGCHSLRCPLREANPLREINSPPVVSVKWP